MGCVGSTYAGDEIHISVTDTSARPTPRSSASRPDLDDQPSSPTPSSTRSSRRSTLSSDSKAGASIPRTSFHHNYCLISRLGKGAFARVYLAHFRRDKEDGSEGPAEVAVKIADLRSTRDSTIPMLDHRLRRNAEKEAMVLYRAGGLDRCVSYVDFFVNGHFAYLVMEKCEMSLLQALERSTELNEYTLAHAFRGMLAALAAIHGVGIVHRDVKPDNFLCNGGLAQGVVKLCDFGLADVLSARQLELKDSYGTAPFMSPEMLSDKGYASKTDIWSVGVVCYVLLYGQFPYSPQEKTGKAMKAAIQTGVPEPTFLPRPIPQKPKGGTTMEVLQISDGATSFVTTLLERDPEVRPSATVALTDAWMRLEPTAEDNSRVPSLRMMLSAAKRAGAFTPPQPAATECPMERELAALQSKHHGKACRILRSAADAEWTKVCERMSRLDSCSKESTMAYSVQTPLSASGEDRQAGAGSLTLNKMGLSMSTASTCPPLDQSTPKSTGAGPLMHRGFTVRSGGSPRAGRCLDPTLTHV